MRYSGVIACGLLAGLGGQASGAEGPPRLLVVALDGIPYRVAEQARRAGAFAEWPATARMISTFPSVTNVAFTAMFEPFGADAAPGYEVRYYDWDRNQLVGGTPIGYKERGFAWRDYFDVVGRSLGSKLAVYTTPSRKSRKELASIAKVVLQDPRDVLFAHIGTSDAMQHLHGDRATVDLLLELDTWIERLRAEHLRARGRPIEFALVSDHGNSTDKIHGVFGIPARFDDAGLDAATSLVDANDVIATSFGLVGFGALYTRPENAESAARAVTGHKGLDLVAWRTGKREITVVNRKRRARVLWRDGADGLHLAYVTDRGDPLRLNRARHELHASKRIDAEGFARDRDWFEATFDERYPDALRRLVDAFISDTVRNRATLLVSLRPGYAMGWKSGYAGSWLRGGRLEGTHGALDAESSNGFFLVDNPRHVVGPAVRASDALAPFVDRWRLANRDRGDHGVAGRSRARPERTGDAFAD